MGELEVREIPNVFTGELVPIDDADALAGYLELIREKARELQQVRAGVEHFLLEHATRAGAKTLHTGNHDVTVTGGPVTKYDPDVLEELLEAGLPRERFDELVTFTVTAKVNANVAKSIASANPAYADIIERSKSIEDKRYGVSVK